MLADFSSSSEEISSGDKNEDVAKSESIIQESEDIILENNGDLKGCWARSGQIQEFGVVVLGSSENENMDVMSALHRYFRYSTVITKIMLKEGKSPDENCKLQCCTCFTSRRILHDWNIVS